MPRLKVVLNGARNLPKKSLGRSPDPIVEMSIGGSRQKSTHKSSTINPVWNETFMFNVNNPQNDSLFIQLFDYETIGDNILMGNVSVRINELGRGIPESKELTLAKLKSGTLYITLTAEDFGLGGGNTSQTQQAPQYNPSVQGTQQYHQRPPSMTNLHQQQPYQQQPQQQYGGQVPQQQYGTQVSPQYSPQQQQQPYGTAPPQQYSNYPSQNPQYGNNSSMSQIPVQQYQQQQQPQQYGVYPQPSAPPSYGGSAPPQNPQYSNNSSMSQIPVQQYQQQQQPYGTAPPQPYGNVPGNYPPPQNPQYGGAPQQYGAYPPQNQYPPQQPY